MTKEERTTNSTYKKLAVQCLIKVLCPLVLRDPVLAGSLMLQIENQQS
jgi:hypothetical protein